LEDQQQAGLNRANEYQHLEDQLGLSVQEWLTQRQLGLMRPLVLLRHEYLGRLLVPLRL
jgi:AraC-like DNA-binding protein